MLNITLFYQIFSKLGRRSFTKFSEEKDTNKHQKGYNRWTHLVSMLFCQFAKRQSVRDISNGLGSATGNLNLSNLVAIIRLKLFVKIDLQLWLDNPFEEIDTSKIEKYLQGVLF